MTPHRPELKAGAVGFNRGRPVRLLHRIGVLDNGDLWYVEPVFVSGPERDELFLPGDRFKPVHGF